jgi:SH3-like domain-containing protein
MARFAPLWILVSLLLWGAPAVALAVPRVPTTPARHTFVRKAADERVTKAADERVTKAADERPTPVVRPHGALHPARPPHQRQPQQPLPLPPPLPEEAAQPAAKPAASAAGQAAPSKPAEAAKPAGTGLPLPRFAALRTDDVNMRTGPGFRYPITWVYKRRDLPMEIEREFEVWRLVQDPDGIKGWVHEATLTGRRTFLVQGADATLRAKPDDDAPAVAVLKVGVVGRIRSCDAGSAWCRVQVLDYSGYLKRSQFWGTLPGEVIAP